MKTISNQALADTGLTELALPDSVTSFSSTALSGMKEKLTSIRWTAGIPTVPSGLFEGFTALERVELPEGVTAIASQNAASGTFSSCTSLTTVSLPSTLELIGYSVFSGIALCRAPFCVRAGHFSGHAA